MSRKVDECKPLIVGLLRALPPAVALDDSELEEIARQGLTLVHVTAQLEQLQDTFMR